MQVKFKLVSRNPTFKFVQKTKRNIKSCFQKCFSLIHYFIFYFKMYFFVEMETNSLYGIPLQIIFFELDFFQCNVANSIKTTTSIELSPISRKTDNFFRMYVQHPDDLQGGIHLFLKENENREYPITVITSLYLITF